MPPWRADHALLLAGRGHESMGQTRKEGAGRKSLLPGEGPRILRLHVSAQLLTGVHVAGHLW